VLAKKIICSQIKAGVRVSLTSHSRNRGLSAINAELSNDRFTWRAQRLEEWRIPDIAEACSSPERSRPAST